MQFTILTCFKNVLQAEFDKLNKKCEKYGNEQLSFVVLRAFEENNKEKLEIEVSGCTPKIGDYELISVISQLPDGTNIVNNVPGKETPLEFLTIVPALLTRSSIYSCLQDWMCFFAHQGLYIPIISFLVQKILPFC